MSKTIVALYADVRDARKAVDDLTAAGVDHEDVSLVVPDPEGKRSEWIAEGKGAEGKNPRDAAAEGAVAGGVLGGLAGLLFGIGALTIPGVGPVVLLGPIYTTVMGAGAGGIGGGLLGALVEQGVPEEEAKLYREGLRRGHSVLAVEADDRVAPQVTDILARHNAMDLEEADRRWATDEGTWSEDDKRPDQFVPARDDKADQHRYATGAMGSDKVDAGEPTRSRPPLPTEERD